MSKRISSADILASFRRGHRGKNTLLLLDRLQRLEERKQKQVASKQKAILQSVQLMGNLNRFNRQKKIAELGGFEGSVFEFFSNPEVGQAQYQTGIERLQKEPDLFRETFGPTIGQVVGEGLLDVGGNIASTVKNIFGFLNPDDLREPISPTIKTE